jgi:CheY-like chemotaxis protein
LEKYLMESDKIGLSRSELLLQGLKILVVDDEADGRELLQIILSQSGAEVKAVESVKEALTVFQQSVPDVLVSDIGMPDQDGYTLIRHIRKLETAAGGGVAALALTAYAGFEDYNRTVAAGFNGHLNKPVEPAKLVEAVAVLAGRVRGKQINVKRF